MEIFISDNASEEPDVERIARKYAEKDCRIRYVRQKQNIGMHANYKYLIDNAQGEYMIYLSDDDYLANEFIEKTLNKLLSDDSAIGAWSSLRFIDENNIENIKKENYSKNDSPNLSSDSIVDNIVKWNMRYFWCPLPLSKTEVLKKHFDIDYKKSWGSDVHYMKLLLLHGKILKVDEILYTYRTRKESCYEAVDYKDSRYNKYTNIHPYMDQLLKSFEIVLESKQVSFFDKILFYFKMWYNILKVDRVWIYRASLFSMEDFLKTLKENKDRKSIFIMLPIYFDLWTVFKIIRTL